MRKLLLFTWLSMALWVGGSGQNVIRIASQTVIPGQTYWIEVEVNNADPFVALQFDLAIPPVFRLDESSIQLNPDRISSHEIQSAILDGDTVRFISYSTENVNFTGTSGWLIRCKLTAGAIPGDYTFTPENIVAGDASGTPLVFTAVPGIIRLAAPDIELDQTSLDFGRTAANQQTSRTLTLYNSGNEILQIAAITNPENQFTIVPDAPFTINAGSSQTLNITFNPTWKGVFSFSVPIASSDPDEPVSTFQVLATSYTINEIHVGNLSVFSGSYGELTLSVNNMEPFTAIQFDLLIPSEMTFQADSIWFIGRSVNHQITASQIDANRLRIVGYSPDNSSFTGSSGDLIQIGFHIEGTGGYYGIGIENGIIGDATGSNIVSAVYGGSLQIAAPDINYPTNLDFGQVSSLESKTMDLTITNTGNDDLILTEADFNNPVFSLLTGLPLEIPIGQQRLVSVKYLNPVEGLQAGRLRLFSNDPDENPVIINLSGSTFIPNQVYVQNLTDTLGTDVLLEIAVKNFEEFVGLQLDISYSSDTFNLDIANTVTTTRLPDHQVEGTQISAGKVRIVVYSLSQTPGTGGDGTVIRIPVGLLIQKAGHYPFHIENVILGNSQAENIIWGTTDGVMTLQAPEVTVRKSLNQGWTWFSINVEPQSWALADVLQSINPSDNDYIKNQTASSTYYDGFGWFGDLNTLNPRQLFKIKLATASELVLTASPVNPEDYPISLVTGWNWIGFLPQTAQSVVDVFTGYPLSENDYIKNQTLSTTYYDDWGWFGEMANLEPTDGYMLKTSQGGILTYTEQEPLKNGNLGSDKLKAFDMIQPESYEHSGQITASIYLDGRNFSSEDYCLFSVVDGEVRGVSRGMWFEPGQAWIHNHLTYSNIEEGDTVRFRLHDTQIDAWYEFEEFVVFKTDMLVANARDPFILKNSALLSSSDYCLEPSLDVWPNPVSTIATIRFTIPNDQPVSIEMVDFTGRVIDHMNLGVCKGGKYTHEWDIGNLIPGIYYLRLTGRPEVNAKVIVSR
ncbi:MAG: choice-of-anchor D domain-containing protein [Bacteroidales bacterium]|nr:choice-of-anchor D domain-containing protein [Bacteroidales bacterium]